MENLYVRLDNTNPEFYIAEIRQNGEETAHEAAHRAGLELLRAGLWERYGLRIDEPGLSEEVAFGEHGKPYLTNHPDIHFNISHSHGYAVCALADRPVGVDIEKIVPVRDALIQRTLTDEEQSAFARLIERGFRRDEVFFRFWTLKESYFKWDGCGLTKELKEIEFTLSVEGTDKEHTSDEKAYSSDAENGQAGWHALCSDPRVSCGSFIHTGFRDYLVAWCTAH